VLDTKALNINLKPKTLIKIKLKMPTVFSKHNNAGPPVVLALL